MTSRLASLRTALEAVPAVLLSEDLERSVEETIASVDALEHLSADPIVVVVSGPAGSGKSTIVNALVGEDLVTVSPIRPTTTTVTAVGTAETVKISGVSDAVETDALPEGVVIVDTPPWDRAPDEIGSLLSKAALAVVVVTPSRYGDDATRANVVAASHADRMELVVNRLPARDAEFEQLEDAIHEQFEVAPYAVFREGSPVQLGSGLVKDLQPMDGDHARRRVLERAAAGSSRTIATALTRGVSELGELQEVLSAKSEPSIMLASVDTGTWEDARRELVRRAIDLADTFDASVERTADNDLAKRIRKSFSPFDFDAHGVELDDWRDQLVSVLKSGAHLGFRKRSGVELIERYGWVHAINPDVPRSRRLARMLRRVEPSSSTAAAESLTALLERPARDRIDAWESAVVEAGSYRPGELLAAANELDGGAAHA